MKTFTHIQRVEYLIVVSSRVKVFTYIIWMISFYNVILILSFNYRRFTVKLVYFSLSFFLLSNDNLLTA